jgi:hypothetical protein
MPDPLEARLREVLAPVAIEPAQERVHRRVRRQRRTIRAGAVVGALVLVLGGAFVVRALRAEDEASVIVDAPPGEWVRLADGPLEGEDPYLVWMHDRLLVYGGADPEDDGLTSDGPDTALTDGATFDPATGTWRPIAPSPERSDEGRVVWTGSKVVVLDAGGLSGGTTIQVYDPAEDTWSVDDTVGPVDGDPYAPCHSDVWTGDVLFFVCGFVAARTYEPSSGAWIDLPTPPVPFSMPRMEWAGDRVVLLSARTSPDGRDVLDETLVTTWDPATGEWAQLDPLPIQVPPVWAWTGSELVTVGFDHRAFAVDPITGQQRELPPVPTDGDFEGCGGTMRVHGDTVIAVVCDDAFELVGDVWRPVEEDEPPFEAGRTVTADDGTEYATDGDEIWVRRPR